MIIVGAKNKGKKLVRSIFNGLTKDGAVQVAALSSRGVQQINNAGQKIANLMGRRISAIPREGEVTLNGVHRVALIVDITLVEESSDV
jgi:hypothetical protein